MKTLDEIKHEGFLEEHRQSRINSLQKTIPEMIHCRNKKRIRRFLFAFTSTYSIAFIVLWKLQGLNTSTLFFALIVTILLFIISYIISSMTFIVDKHEEMIIEKMITEYATLTHTRESNIDMTIEIGKLRNHLLF